MKTMKKSKSLLSDQSKLKIICDHVCDDIERLLDTLNIEYKFNNKMISMCCPIHEGDNPSAVNIYPYGDYYRGNWKCRTHGCDNIFKGSIIGFIRGVLSRQKYNWSKDGDNTCSFDEAVNFALEFINKDIKQIKVSKSDAEKTSFTRIVQNIKQVDDTNGFPKITRTQVRQSLVIPAKYYLDRNYTIDILNKYDVGLCDKANKEMYNRVVVPIYCNDGKNIIGCTGRSIFEKCDKCSGFHDPKDSCPDKDNLWKFSKWKHNQGFKCQNHLYNFANAKDYIQKTKTIIIVESPGNVWRLEQNGIHNSVAIFGSSLSDRQKLLIDCSGAMNIIVLTDNDEAGEKAYRQIQDKCKKIYRIYRPIISKNDIGDMTSEEIEIQIKQYIEKEIK